MKERNSGDTFEVEEEEEDDDDAFKAELRFNPRRDEEEVTTALERIEREEAVEGGGGGVGRMPGASSPFTATSSSLSSNPKTFRYNRATDGLNSA